MGRWRRSTRSSPSDPLGEALHFLRMSGTFYCRSELTAPWGLALPPMAGCLWFHVVTRRPLLARGRAAPSRSAARSRATSRWCRTAKATGCGASRARGAGHLRPARASSVSDRYEILRHGGGGAPTGLVCGAVRFDHPAARTWSRAAGDDPHRGVRSSPQAEWLRSTLRLMAAEAEELRPGGETVITRLADILVIQAIRSWMATRPGRAHRLARRAAGPADRPRLSLIHRDPARDWTVASLADEVAMSRSAFAARFTELVGEPAMQYVARWRMHVALTLLQEKNARPVSWPAGSATGPRRRSAGRSSASSASRPGSVTQPLRSPANRCR